MKINKIVQIEPTLFLPYEGKQIKLKGKKKYVLEINLKTKTFKAEAYWIWKLKNWLTLT